MPDHPFQFGDRSDPFLRRAAHAAVRPILSWVLQADTLAEVYRQVRHCTGECFERRALHVLGIKADCPSSDLVPRRGPLVVASNHPHGALDGLLLGALLRGLRSDVRLLANHLLARIPELRESCFFVDPFEGPQSASRSRAGLRAAHLWLRQGGALVVFPAGEVAHRREPNGVPIDSPWLSTVGRLAVQTGAQVLPASIAGANSRAFYAAGRLHPLLRTALLGRELLKKRGHRVTVRFGQPLSSHQLDEAGQDPALVTNRMRAAVERLAAGAADAPHVRRSDPVADEVSRLNAASLVESGAFQVFCAEAGRMPAVLREIGRLRAITYAAIGEGTGRALDLDAFDDRYLHLFSWDREQGRIVGAYRIGRTDRIVSSLGVKGLYTRTLFRYDQALIERLSPALELGRSFVRAEYQRNYNALLLLWKGIGRFVARNPEYRVLFGPVSISTHYSDSSHAMLMAFLEQNHLDRSLAELVDAINPVVVKAAPVALPTVLPGTIEEVNAVVSTLEADGKGMPVLLRQYLKLNARLIAFNIDPNFGSALDALMMVDLTTVDPAILGRYLGRQDAERFLAHHRESSVGFASGRTSRAG